MFNILWRPRMQNRTSLAYYLAKGPGINKEDIDFYLNGFRKITEPALSALLMTAATVYMGYQCYYREQYGIVDAQDTVKMFQYALFTTMLWYTASSLISTIKATSEKGVEFAKFIGNGLAALIMYYFRDLIPSVITYARDMTWGAPLPNTVYQAVQYPRAAAALIVLGTAWLSFCATTVFMKNWDGFNTSTTEQTQNARIEMSAVIAERDELLKVASNDAKQAAKSAGDSIRATKIESNKSTKMIEVDAAEFAKMQREFAILQAASKGISKDDNKTTFSSTASATSNTNIPVIKGSSSAANAAINAAASLTNSTTPTIGVALN